MLVQIRLLGGVEASAEGTSLPIGYTRGRLLLAWLVLHPGVSFARGELAELLWPEEPEGSARRKLREVVYRLRRALGDGDRPEPLIATTREQLTFRPGPELSCDLLHFDALIGAAHAHDHRRIETCTACLGRLEQAEALAGGPLLAGLELPAGQAIEVVVRHQARHREARAWALEIRATAAVEEARWSDALALLAQLGTVDPEHEPGLRLEMRALVGAGRSAEALGAYETFVARTDRSPADETEEIYQSLLHREYRVPAAEVSPLRVPAPATPLVGRDAEITWLLERLARPDVRLITLIGLGGVGKTRLAIAAARRSAPSWRDGVWFVDAHDCRSGRELALAILTCLGVEGGEREPLAQLLAWLEGREVLWVLDNLEQIDGADAVIDCLLRGAPGLWILATSRSRLGLRAEHLRPMQGLSSADAAALWRARAQQLVPDLEASDEQIVAVCEALGGLPLAIEFAAARVLDTTVDELVQTLRAGLELQSPWSDVPPRQSSMRTILESAARGLPGPAFDALGAVAVFRGPFQPAAAEAVCGTSAEVLRTLVERSLLSVGPSGRFALHPVVAAFAREARPPDRALEDAHARWFLSAPRCEPAEAHLEHDDWREAWRTTWSSGDLELIGGQVLSFYGRMRDLGWSFEAAEWLEEAAIALEDHPTTAAARRCVACSGISAYRVGDHDRARVRLAQATALARQARDTADLVRSLWWWAFVERNLGGPDAALELLDEAITAAEEGQSDQLDNLRYSRATSLYEAGHLLRAREELLQIASRPEGNARTLSRASVCGVLGLCEVLLGDTRGGLARLADAVRELRPRGGSPLNDALNAWACASLVAGRHWEARHRARACLQAYQAQGFVAGIASASAWLAMATVALSDREAASEVRAAVSACLRARSERASLEAACVLGWWLEATDAPLAADLIATVLEHPIAELVALARPIHERLGPGEPLEPSALERLLLRTSA